MSRYHHLSPAYDADDRDDQTQWLLALKDDALAAYARYCLPDSVIASVARAYFQSADNEHLDNLLADSRDEYAKARRLKGEH